MQHGLEAVPQGVIAIVAEAAATAAAVAGASPALIGSIVRSVVECGYPGTAGQSRSGAGASQEATASGHARSREVIWSWSACESAQLNCGMTCAASRACEPAQLDDATTCAASRSCSGTEDSTDDDVGTHDAKVEDELVEKSLTVWNHSSSSGL